VDVLADIDAAGAEIRQHLLERDDLMLGDMAAIVDKDVDGGRLLPKCPPESRVGLVPDANGDTRAFERPASFMNVDTRDVASGSEILPPHIEAAAAQDSDLDQVDLLADEFLEMTVIDVEVVAPFPDASPFFVRVEIRP
jgi:hypothetical protein